MPDAVRTRILEATFANVARFGLTKTTVEDVAKVSGLSRATIYRHFPGGKDELTRSVVVWEASRFFEVLAREVSNAQDLASLVEKALLLGHRAVEKHEVLQAVLQTEPEVLLRQLTVEGARLLVLIRAFLVHYVPGDKVPPGVTALGAADYVARMILSHITAPGSWDLSDPVQVHELVSTQILGWMGPEAVSGRADLNH